MFLDTPSSGEPIFCAGCNRPIAGEPVRIEHESVRGVYHEGCARPLLSVLRALEALAGPWGR